MTFAETLSGMESRERARFILDCSLPRTRRRCCCSTTRSTRWAPRTFFIELDTLAEARTREDPEAEAMVFRWVRVAMCAPLFSVGKYRFRIRRSSTTPQASAP